MRYLWLLAQLLALSLFLAAVLIAYCWSVLRVTFLGIIEFIVLTGD